MHSFKSVLSTLFFMCTFLHSFMGKVPPSCYLITWSDHPWPWVESSHLLCKSPCKARKNKLYLHSYKTTQTSEADAGQVNRSEVQLMDNNSSLTWYLCLPDIVCLSIMFIMKFEASPVTISVLGLLQQAPWEQLWEMDNECQKVLMKPSWWWLWPWVGQVESFHRKYGLDWDPWQWGVAWGELTLPSWAASSSKVRIISTGRYLLLQPSHVPQGPEALPS